MSQVFPEIQLVLWYENSVKVETKNSLIEYGTNGVIGRSRTNLVNDIRKTFNLQGILRDRDEINNFLLSNRGKPFVFRPYNDSYSGLFICSSWNWRWTALNVWEFSATFSEVFRPGWIPTDIPYRMDAGSESSADVILEEPSIYLLYNGSQSGAFLGLVDPYSLNAGVQSSGNLRLENGIFEAYTLFAGNDNGAFLVAGEVVVQTYVLIAGDESGAVVVTPGYFLLFSGSESGSVLSLGEGTTPPYELNTGVESSANIILGEPSGVVYYLNGGSESSAVVSVVTVTEYWNSMTFDGWNSIDTTMWNNLSTLDPIFNIRDLNAGSESGTNLELGEGFVPDPFYNNVSLLLLGNGTNGSTTFVDSGPANRTVTISSGTPIITTSQFKYGNGSITGGRIETPYDAAFDWGTEDFTIEFWFRYSGTLVSDFRFCAGKTGNFFAFGSRIFSGTRRIGVVLENVVWDVELSWTPVGVDTWAHIALTRQGTTMRIFQNGVSLGSASNSRNWNVNNSPFLIMPDTFIASGGAWFDDFRVTKGVARYTANFTPPTQQLPTQWNPNQTTGTLWLDASSDKIYDATTGGNIVTADNGSVARIECLYNTGRNAIQSSTGSRPQLKTNILNGKNVIQFNGTSQFLTGSNTNPIQDSDNFTIVAVFFGIVFSRGRDGSGSGWSVAVTNNETNVVTSSPVSAYVASYSDPGATVSRIVAMEWQSGGFVRNYLNGTLAGNNTTVGTGLRSSTVTYDIGRLNSTYSAASLAELWVTNSVVSTELRQTLEGYMAHKWGLSQNLPNDHPFKNIPPSQNTTTS